MGSFDLVFWSLRMNRFPRCVLIVAIACAVWLSNSAGFMATELSAGSESAIFSMDFSGTAHHKHDHGPGHGGKNHHCATASCTSVFGMQANGVGMRDFSGLLKFAWPLGDSQVRSTSLERDPPIPRFFV